MFTTHPSYPTFPLSRWVRGLAICALLGAVSLSTSAQAQMSGHAGGYMGGHMSGGHRHGADGTGHDEFIMPGLRGLNATPEESTELAGMFRGFETFSRDVTLLPNGIRTVTTSSDPEVMAQLVSHVTGMIQRVSDKDDPQIFIQSPTLDIFFERGDRITSDIEVTDAGIVVIRTSDDPEVVAAMHIHAGEVSDMAERGMQAVHEMMMQRAGN